MPKIEALYRCPECGRETWVNIYHAAPICVHQDGIGLTMQTVYDNSNNQSRPVWRELE